MTKLREREREREREKYLELILEEWFKIKRIWIINPNRLGISTGFILQNQIKLISTLYIGNFLSTFLSGWDSCGRPDIKIFQKLSFYCTPQL